MRRIVQCTCRWGSRCFPTEVIVQDAHAALAVIRTAGCPYAIYNIYDRRGGAHMYITDGQCVVNMGWRRQYVKIPADPIIIDRYLVCLWVINNHIHILGESSIVHHDTIVVSKGRIHFNGLQIEPVRKFKTIYDGRIDVIGYGDVTVKEFVALSMALGADLLY